MGKSPNKGFGRPKAVLAPTDGRASIFGDLGFGYPKAVLAPTRRQMEQGSQKAFVMTKAVLAPTDRLSSVGASANSTLILLHKIQTRASILPPFLCDLGLIFGEALCI